MVHPTPARLKVADPRRAAQDKEMTL